MSNCISPFVLKNGVCVPCGKCEICKSNRRNEWSIRLAIHVEACKTMPLMVTLTYDNAHIPEINSNTLEIKRHLEWYSLYKANLAWNFPTVYRPDVSAFLKAYKRKFSLDNQHFQYFGCSEYGDIFGRPHIHLLFFGDDELYKAFFEDTEKARSRINSCWSYGNVHVCLADWSGIHYCTKYVLKDGFANLPDCVNKPFTIASNGLGMNFLKTEHARAIRGKLETLKTFQEQIFANAPAIDFHNEYSIQLALDYWRRFVPDFSVVLSDGRRVVLPRPIRRKLTGSFEHFKDNPLWVYNTLQVYLDSINYHKDNGDYDACHNVSMAMEKSLSHIDKIKQRMCIKRYNKRLKREKYESV